MVKKPLFMEIPESLVLSLDELAKRIGRKKNLLSQYLWIISSG